jgi:hypothetical protein
MISLNGTVTGPVSLYTITGIEPNNFELQLQKVELRLQVGVLRVRLGVLS